MNVIIVIPAYNEEKTITEVIEKCKQLTANSLQPTVGSCEPPAVGRIIVVDDGSSDDTARVARAAGALVLSHPINRGLGAALATGIEGALRMQNEAIVVTLDADGQHDPAEIIKVVEPIIKGEAEVVIGSRFLSAPVVIASGGSRAEGRSASGGQSSATMGSPRPTAGGARDDINNIVPFSRRIANTVGNIVTYLLFGIRVTDSQSGFRAFSCEAAKKIRIRTNTMEVSSEIIREIKLHNLRFREVPIAAIYTNYSLSKGQGFLKGLETLWKLIVLKFFR